MGMAMECSHLRNCTSRDVIARFQTQFSPHSTHVGCEEQVSNVKCTRPFLSCEGEGTQTNIEHVYVSAIKNSETHVP